MARTTTARDSKVSARGRPLEGAGSAGGEVASVGFMLILGLQRSRLRSQR